MRTHLIPQCLLVLLLVAVPSLHAQPHSYRYWLVFQKNFRDRIVDNETHAERPADDLKLSVIITADRDARGSVTVPGRPAMPFSLAAGRRIVTAIDSSLQLQSSERIEHVAVLVETDVPVSVVGADRRFQTTDTYLAFPDESLGTEYRAACYSLLQSDLLAQVAVVAAYDDTHVTITPSERTQQGRPAGIAYDVTLNRGDAYQVRPKNNPASHCDLTGTLITSDRPVAVFSGHNCAYVPERSCKACNMLVEELPPASAWGMTYALMNVKPRSFSLVRVVAGTDSTHVAINGEAVATLAAGGFSEQRITGPAVVTADAPVLVVQYAPGYGNGDDIGDPTMIVVPPVERWVTSLSFSTPFSAQNAQSVATSTIRDGDRSESWDDRIIIAVPHADGAAVKLDGTPIADGEFTTVSGSAGFGVASVRVTPGVHTLTSSEPFGAYLYGIGRDSQEFDAYGHALIAPPASSGTK